jgi:hypothetical protein
MVEKSEKLSENQQMCSTCWSYEPPCVYFAYISNKNGCSGSFHVNDPYFKTSYFVLKWAKVIKLPSFIFIMLCFKTVVATPGLEIRSSTKYADPINSAQVAQSLQRKHNAIRYNTA